MLNIKVVTWSLAIWTTFTFVFCVVYGLLTPSSVHMTAFLEQVLPGFEWLSWQGFFVGLVQSFLYGAYAGLVYVPIYNFCPRNRIERAHPLDRCWRARITRWRRGLWCAPTTNLENGQLAK